MTQEPYITNLLQNYQKTLDIALLDKIKYKSMGTEAALILAGYYNNIKKSRDTAEAYVDTGLSIDSTHAQLKGIKEYFNKQPAKGTPKPTKTVGNKPTSAIRKPGSTG